MIEVENLSVEKGNTRIIQEINFTINAGEIVGVIGPNGAGKTTLLQAVAGELTPATGMVSILGKSLHEMSPQAQAKYRGVLSQQVQLKFGIEVLDLVVLGRYLYQKKERQYESEAIAYWCLEKVGMKSFAHRNIRTLSGGEQKRVHFARVLAQLYENKKVEKFLLLDEPIASLDIARQHQLLALVKTIAKDLNFGVLVILHDMNMTAQYVDKILLMNRGNIVAKGTPYEVLNQKNIQQVFGIQSFTNKHPLYDCPQIITY